MLTISTRVQVSAIDGLGLFACQPIAKGAQIWEFDKRFDVTIPEQDLTSLPPAMQEFLEIYGYWDIDIPGMIIICSDNYRFMNHSQTPNISFPLGQKGYALRDIEAGEELTCNYSEYNPKRYEFTHHERLANS